MLSSSRPFVTITVGAALLILLTGRNAAASPPADDRFSFQQAGQSGGAEPPAGEAKQPDKKPPVPIGAGPRSGQTGGGDAKPPATEPGTTATPKAPALGFKMKDIDGKERDLREFYGRVVLMVNTASQCGYTPQYAALEELYERHKDRGFVILAFPSNDFGSQEPGTNEDIKKFCADNFQIKFPLFAKVAVKGKEICTLYKYLTAPDAGHKFGGEIKWNFTKFLVNRRGEVIDRWASAEHPIKSKKMSEAIEKALADPPPPDAEQRQPDIKELKPANKPVFQGG